MPSNMVFPIYIYIYIYRYTYKGCWKSSMPHPEQRAIAEYFYYGNTLLLLIKLEKLIQISVLISVQVKPIQRWKVYNRPKIWGQLRSFWMTLIYNWKFNKTKLSFKTLKNIYNQMR